jgi:hypothetical protein
LHLLTEDAHAAFTSPLNENILASTIPGEPTAAILNGKSPRSGLPNHHNSLFLRLLSKTYKGWPRSVSYQTTATTFPFHIHYSLFPFQTLSFNPSVPKEKMKPSTIAIILSFAASTVASPYARFGDTKAKRDAVANCGTNQACVTVAQAIEGWAQSVNTVNQFLNDPTLDP